MLNVQTERKQQGSPHTHVVPPEQKPVLVWGGKVWRSAIQD